MKSGSTLNLRFTIWGYACTESLNELGLEICLGFHVTSSVAPVSVASPHCLHDPLLLTELQSRGFSEDPTAHTTDTCSLSFLLPG